MSLDAIRKINDYGIKCSVLTKGILPQDLIHLSPDNEYGITLVSLDEAFTKEYEAGAATVSERLSALRYLHEHGAKTWVSIEPYPTPNILNQDLNAILTAVSFVDKIIFGRLHYNKAVSNYHEYSKFYDDCSNIVINHCRQEGIQCHIKKGTQSEKE